MKTPVKHIPPRELLNGKIGDNWPEHLQAFVDSVEWASQRTVDEPAFFESLPAKVTEALKAHSLVEAEEIVDHVARNAKRFSLVFPYAKGGHLAVASSRAKTYLEQCQAMVRQVPIVYGSQQPSRAIV